MAKKLVRNLEEIAASVFFVMTLGLVLANIVLRYFFGTGLVWSSELATAFFVWSVFLGGAAAFKTGQHIGIDLMVKYLKGKKRILVRIFVDILLIAVTAFITYLSIKYIQTSYKKPTPVLEISTAYISSSIPVSFTIMVLRTAQELFKDLKLFKEAK